MSKLMSKVASFFNQFSPQQLRQDIKCVSREYSIGQLRKDALTRSWLFKVVVSWCLLFGFMCLLIAAAVLLKAAFHTGVSTRPVMGLMSVSLVILVSTALMWKFSVWGRNIAVVTVACMGWVVSTSISMRTGGSLVPQLMTIAFACMSLACFTSPSGVAMFRKQPSDSEVEGAAE
jgi:hypothetical protein